MQPAQPLAAQVGSGGRVRRVVPDRLPGLARVAAAIGGVGAGLGALAIAAGPGRFTTYAGSSAVGAALTSLAGLAVIAGGLVIWLGQSSRRAGDLALAAGLTWFTPVWVAWQDGPPLIPSVAMVAAAFTFPIIVHLVLAQPAGRAGSGPARVLVAVVYSEALAAAVVLALFRDPYSDPGCLADCNVNVFLVRSLPSPARAVEIVDRWITAAAALGFIGICAARLARASRPARRRLLPVAVPAMAFAAAASARAAALLAVTVEDPFNAGLFSIFVVESSAVTLLAAGLIWGVVHATSERRAIARITASLGEAPAPGALQAALATALRDPGLRIAYWLPAGQRYVDAGGQAVPEPSAPPGRAVTRLIRGERTIAAVTHSAAVPAIDGHIGPAIRLGLENERLQAELLARLTELRASRARIVETADATRRGLERDLHDGAQQQLLALSYDVRLALAAARTAGDTPTETALVRAVEETRIALEDLRDLAHGIYPAVLTDSGIGPALATLADTAPLAVQIRPVPDRRYPAAAEAVAYFAVAEALGDAGRQDAEQACVTIDHRDGRLVVMVESDRSGEAPAMTAVADRVGALGGTLTTGPNMCRVEIPCG